LTELSKIKCGIMFVNRAKGLHCVVCGVQETLPCALCDDILSLRWPPMATRF